MSRIINTGVVLAMSGLALAGGASVSAIAQAGNTEGVHRVAPMHGLSFNLGTKRVVGYYMADAKACNVTLLVGEASNGENDLAGSAARFHLVVAPGQASRFETAEGKSLEVACQVNASALTFRTLDMVAYNSAK